MAFINRVQAIKAVHDHGKSMISVDITESSVTVIKGKHTLKESADLTTDIMALAIEMWRKGLIGTDGRMKD